MNRFARVCLVSGGATGIGAACALAYARQGWSVGISHYGSDDRDNADAVARECEAAGASTVICPLDVTREDECHGAVEAVLSRWGRVDVLVNSAGTTRFIAHKDLDALNADEFRRTYEVNLIGAYQLSRAAAKGLAASGSGSIVNISSIAGVIGRGSSVAYAASKGALNTMTLALARALAPRIRVNAIAPGLVTDGLPSRLLDPARYDEVVRDLTRSSPLQRVSVPDEIAALAWFLGAQAPGITGEVVMVDNGLHLNAG